MIHWQQLLEKDNLSEGELRQIPSDNVTIFHTSIDVYKDNGWDIEALLNGTNLKLSDFNDFSKWLSPRESELFMRNYFSQAPIFLSHKSAYNLGFEYKHKDTIIKSIIKYIPYEEIMADAGRITTKMENSFTYSIREMKSCAYSLKIIPKVFKYDIQLGHELHISKGYLDSIHKVKNIKMFNKRSYCYSSDLKKIIDFFYNGHGFSYDSNSIFLNGDLFAKKGSPRNLPEIKDLENWSDEDRVFIILKDYTYKNELIFEKGSVYNAPYGYFTWNISRGSILKEHIKNLFFTFMAKNVRKLEYQLDQNNLKSKELLQLSVALEEEKREKEFFLANIVHEIKSPLASIVMLIDSISSNIETSPDYVRDGFIQLGDKSGKLINFVDNVMSYFSVNNRNLILNFDQIDIAMLLSDVLDNFQHVSKNKWLSIICSIAPNKFFIHGDYYRLVQVFLNLISNSVKFTAVGSIKIDARFIGGYVCISVKDSGIGIDKSKIKNIFNKFNLGQCPSCDNGLGLGLYISDKIVEQHKGSIDVESELGIGSEFKVYLPSSPLE